MFRIAADVKRISGRCAPQNAPGIQDYINERKMAVGVPKLAIFRIETMPLIIPPIEKQDEFASFRAQVDKSKCDTSNITSATQYQLAS